jgi:hypothetical protein
MTSGKARGHFEEVVTPDVLTKVIQRDSQRTHTGVHSIPEALSFQCRMMAELRFSVGRFGHACAMRALLWGRSA